MRPSYVGPVLPGRADPHVHDRPVQLRPNLGRYHHQTQEGEADVFDQATTPLLRSADWFATLPLAYDW